MFARTSRSFLVAKRSMSASPRMTIAQNILGMSEVIKATDEAALTAAKAAKTIDAKKLPAALAGHEAYLATAATSSATGASVVDQSAWQNLKGMDFVVAEASRESTWPFLVGIV